MKTNRTTTPNSAEVLCRQLSPDFETFSRRRQSLAQIFGCVLALSFCFCTPASAKNSKKTSEVAATPTETVPVATVGTVSAPVASASCTACHGTGGVSANDLWPNLAGQKREYLAKQLRAFRSGERTDPLMSAIAQTLKESDVDELAQYFASLKSSL